MGYKFLDELATPGVVAAQAANGSRHVWERGDIDRVFDRFTADEAEFIAARDSFYMATVGESGWPYVQHRGGPPGFLKVLGPTTLGCLDFRGNRQYISVGNLAASDDPGKSPAGGKVCLFLMDYPHRARLKILAHARTVALADDPGLAAALALPGYKGKPERMLRFELDAFDWNCSQHITPRFTAVELVAAGIAADRADGATS